MQANDSAIIKHGTGASLATMIGCECFSSTGGTATSNGIIVNNSGSNATLVIVGCNVHDALGFGITNTSTGAAPNLIIVDSIFAKNKKDGIVWECYGGSLIKNCTIDGNLGSGITHNGNVMVMNCIISNHTTGGKFGLLQFAAGTITQTVDYNTFYNNAGNYSNTTLSFHDTALSGNPYVNQSTENYTLA
jgi:hypothetical protein